MYTWYPCPFSGAFHSGGVLEYQFWLPHHPDDSDVYLARVAPVNIDSVSGYQYWNGSAYTSTRLVYPDYNGYAPSAVLTGLSQGSIVYSDYYNLYIYLAPGGGFSGRMWFSEPRVNKICVRLTFTTEIIAFTAQNPEGPWNKSVVLYQGSGILYAPVAQAHFDTSGKTLTFDYSIFESSVLQTVKVVSSPCCCSFVPKSFIRILTAVHD